MTNPYGHVRTAERRNGAPTSRVRRPRRPPAKRFLPIALVSTMALAGVWRLSAAQDNSDPPPPDAVATFPDFDAQTPVLSARRTPSVLARETSSSEFELALRPLGGAVLDGSCAAISVDGILNMSDGINTPVTPASTLKFVIGAVALEIIGPTTTFTTEVKGELTNGTVTSLFLVGGGDPLLAAAWYPNDARYSKFPQQPATSLDALADATRSAGLTQISGNIIGDATRYDNELYPPTWPITFRAIEGGPIGALMVNDAMVFGEQNRSNDPAVGAASEFGRLLLERGVSIAGAATSGQTPAGVKTLASVTSAPLIDIVGEMLLTSDNNTAEMLLKEIGYRARGSGTRTAGISAVEERMRAWGIDLTQFTIVDGSGLSRENKISCADFLKVLERFSTNDDIVKRLPLAGTSGTLIGYFGGTSLQSKLLAKTGSLTGVKGLVGFLQTPSGSTIRIALLLEGPNVSEEAVFRPIWEKFLADALGAYSTGPSADAVQPLPPLPAPAVS